MITYITKNEMEIQKIANLALKKELYVSWEWCLYGLLSAIESSSKEDKNTHIIIIKKGKKEIGLIFYSQSKYKMDGVDTQIFVKEKYRRKGYGKLLVEKLKTVLPEKKFKKIRVSSGLKESKYFWNKMRREDVIFYKSYTECEELIAA